MHQATCFDNLRPYSMDDGNFNNYNKKCILQINFFYNSIHHYYDLCNYLGMIIKGKKFLPQNMVRFSQQTVLISLSEICQVTSPQISISCFFCIKYLVNIEIQQFHKDLKHAVYKRPNLEVINNNSNLLVTEIDE